MNCPSPTGTIRAADLRKIKTADDDFGLMTYDPALMNTAAVKSRITYIDGDRGILRYRGYPIEQLAEQSSYLETAYLLLHGELPTRAQLSAWTQVIHEHRVPPDGIERLLDGFAPRSAPDGRAHRELRGAVHVLSGIESDLRRDDPPHRRYTASSRRRRRSPPTRSAIAAGCRSCGPPTTSPSAATSSRCCSRSRARAYTPNPVLERALDVLFILHADHEQNCSTFAMRSVGSSHTDPFSSTAGATAALYGPLHGGANEAVLRMLNEIGSIDHVPDFIARVKAGDGRLMGFGHRVYKSYDPRAKIVKRTADEVFEVTGRNPLLEIAMELERIALQDDYFVSRKLYPNVDFYSGLIYQAMGFPTDMFPVLFAIPRTAGWLAQWEEMLLDPDTKIVRPRQVYTGRRRADLRARSSGGADGCGRAAGG